MTAEFLDALFVHPLKGGRAVSRGSALAEPGGFAEDRRWMLVRQNGDPVMLKSHPRLAAISIDVDGLALLAADPDGEELSVPPPPRDAARLPVRTKDGERTAQVAGPEAHRWFSERLGETVWLAHLPPDPEQRGFAAKAPFLLTVAESLADLNTRLATPVGMDRFRANLVVSGFPAWAEDGWHNLRIGGAVFKVVGPCPRCPNTTVDPATCVVGEEPLKTLRSFRTRDGKALFGVFLETRRPGTLRTGDAVEVLD